MSLAMELETFLLLQAQRYELITAAYARYNVWLGFVAQGAAVYITWQLYGHLLNGRGLSTGSLFLLFWLPLFAGVSVGCAVFSQLTAVWMRSLVRHISINLLEHGQLERGLGPREDSYFSCCLAWPWWALRRRELDRLGLNPNSASADGYLDKLFLSYWNDCLTHRLPSVSTSWFLLHDGSRLLVAALIAIWAASDQPARLLSQHPWSIWPVVLLLFPLLVSALVTTSAGLSARAAAFAESLTRLAERSLSDTALAGRLVGTLID